MTPRQRIERLRRTYNLETYDYRDVAAALALLDEWESRWQIQIRAESEEAGFAADALALLDKESL